MGLQLTVAVEFGFLRFRTLVSVLQQLRLVEIGEDDDSYACAAAASLVRRPTTPIFALTCAAHGAGC